MNQVNNKHSKIKISFCASARQEIFIINTTKNLHGWLKEQEKLWN